MPQGVVVKTIGGYYFVQGKENSVQCSLRGKIKRSAEIFVGDDVIYSPISEGNGVIEKILQRRNLLRRPAVANIDQAVIIFACAIPDFHPLVISRFTVFAEEANLKIILCFNKVDLITSEKRKEIELAFKPIGYKFLFTSVKTHEGVGELFSMIEGKKNVFCGPSGVGKSSLLNALKPGLQLQTGNLSEKIKRGKHTTRHAELLRIGDRTYVVDTPGFSYLQMTEIPKESLANYFNEMIEYSHNCKFSSCLHYKEPRCGVKKAVEEGKISKERYEHYLTFLQEIMGGEGY